MRIGIFGGAFDPIHIGHLNLAENILKKTNLDKIIFIPTARPPHKPLNPVTAFTDRFEMVKLTIEKNPLFEISDIENKYLGQFSYSLLTVRRLKNLFPDANFSLIIGEDSLQMLHTWYKAKELVNECEIITYPRPGHKVFFNILQKNWNNDTAEKLFNSIVSLPLTDISSTKLRDEFYISQKVRTFLPEKVREYIINNRLYTKKN